MFEGARADLSKSLNMNPAFQVTHSFTLGASQANPLGGPPTAGGGGTYNFGALYATSKVDESKHNAGSLNSCSSFQVFMQGGVDHEGAVTARFNYGWVPSDTTKIQANVGELWVDQVIRSLADL